jgi:hypothetical protein
MKKTSSQAAKSKQLTRQTADYFVLTLSFLSLFSCLPPGAYIPITKTASSSSTSSTHIDATPHPSSTPTTPYISRTVPVNVTSNPNGLLRALAVDYSDNLYYTLAEPPDGTGVQPGGTIEKITSTGTHTTLAGSTTLGSSDGNGTSATFGVLSGLFCQGASNAVFAIDSYNNNLRELNLGTSSVTTTYPNNPLQSNLLSNPTAVVMNSGGTYISQPSQPASGTPAQIISQSGTNAAVLSLTGTALVLPSGLALSASETTLYVADPGNFSVDLITLATGAVSVLAGGTYSGASTDGTGTAAKFIKPVGMVLDPSGSYLYVTDLNTPAANYTGLIRRINVSTGVVTTLSLASGTSTFNPSGPIAIDGSGRLLFHVYNPTVSPPLNSILEITF